MSAPVVKLKKTVKVTVEAARLWADLDSKSKNLRQRKSGADDTIWKHAQESNVESTVGVQNIVEPNLYHISGIAGNFHREFTTSCMCDAFSLLITVICRLMMIQLVKLQIYV